MSWMVFYKLLAIFITVVIGWFVGRMRWLDAAPGRPSRSAAPRGGAQESLGRPGASLPDASAGGNDPARVLSNAAFYLFVPALLFRTTARLDVSDLPWLLLLAFFGPLLLLALMVYGYHRARGAHGSDAARPSVQAINAVFGNTMQVGVPLAAGVFGEEGLGIHVTVMSLHALMVLSVLTSLVELDLARERARGQAQSLVATLVTTVRNTVIHPVVLPVLAGLTWNALGLPLPAVIDEVLQVLSTAVVPLCLTLIGMSLAYYGWPAAWRGMLGLVALKLLALPAMVLVIAHWGLGLSGLPLAVIVMLAALPTGSNALIFAQRYRCLEGESTATIVLSTVLFVLTAPLWLSVLSWVAG